MKSTIFCIQETKNQRDT